MEIKVLKLRFNSAEQDSGLEELAKTISRQKHIAVKIGTEVDVHNGKICYANVLSEDLDISVTCQLILVVEENIANEFKCFQKLLMTSQIEWKELLPV